MYLLPNSRHNDEVEPIQKHRFHLSATFHRSIHCTFFASSLFNCSVSYDDRFINNGLAMMMLTFTLVSRKKKSYIYVSCSPYKRLASALHTHHRRSSSSATDRREKRDFRVKVIHIARENVETIVCCLGITAGE